MAVKIRMRRMGNRNNPFYRLVVTDSRSRRDGRFVEILGHYNPLTEPADFKIEEDRALYWLKQGAGLSDTVKSLLKRQGILEKFTGVTYASIHQEKEEISKKARKRAKLKAAAEAEKAKEPQQAEEPEKPAEAEGAAQESAPAEAEQPRE